MGPPKKSPPPNRPGGTSVRRPPAADARDARASPAARGVARGVGGGMAMGKNLRWPSGYVKIAIENGDL